MNYGRRFVTLYRRQDQDHLLGKEMQKSKMAVWGGLTKEKQKAKEKRKDVNI